MASCPVMADWCQAHKPLYPPSDACSYPGRSPASPTSQTYASVKSIPLFLLHWVYMVRGEATMGPVVGRELEVGGFRRGTTC